MATDSKTPAAESDSPQVAHLKFQEKQFVQKLKDLDSKKPEQGFDYTAAKARTEMLLKEVRAALKDAK